MTYEQKCQRWRAIIEKQAVSGLSQAAFCRREGISKSTFYAWTKKLPAAQPKQAVIPVNVVPQQQSPRQAPEQLTLTTPEGYQLAFPETLPPDTLRQLIKAIAS